MQVLSALLVLALDAGSALPSPPGLREAAREAAAGQAAPPVPVATSAGAPADPQAPPCLGDVCQPLVAVPGYEPRFSMRGARTRLTLEALDALSLEPVATVAWWLAATGVRLDYTPAALDAAANGGVGVSHFQVLLRWRIDAWGSPTWLERRR